MADAPKRIQRKRTRGWRMPEGAIVVTRPTKWGNPYKLKDGPHDLLDALLVVVSFEEYLASDEGRDLAEAAKRELRGHDLACWCRLDEPCHADTLLRIANE